MQPLFTDESKSNNISSALQVIRYTLLDNAIEVDKEPYRKTHPRHRVKKADR